MMHVLHLEDDFKWELTLHIDERLTTDCSFENMSLKFGKLIADISAADIVEKIFNYVL